MRCPLWCFAPYFLDYHNLYINNPMIAVPKIQVVNQSWTGLLWANRSTSN